MLPAELLRVLVDQAGGVTAFSQRFRYRTTVTPQTVRDWLAGKRPINPNAMQTLQGLYRHTTRTTTEN